MSQPDRRPVTNQGYRAFQSGRRADVPSPHRIAIDTTPSMIRLATRPGESLWHLFGPRWSDTTRCTFLVDVGRRDVLASGFVEVGIARHVHTLGLVKACRIA